MGCSSSRNNQQPKVELSDDLGNTETAKIIIVGNTKVGKTSLLKSYMTNRPYNNPKPEQPKRETIKKVTINIDKSDPLKTIELDLHIWETIDTRSSQSSIVVRNVQCAILCYSIDDRESFNSLEQWRNVIADNNEDCLFALVSTKNDLAISQSTEIRMSNQCAVDEAINLGCFTHANTSAYYDHDSIQQLFTRITEEICNQMRFDRRLKGTFNLSAD